MGLKFYKTPIHSKELQLLQYLKMRGTLPDKFVRSYNNAKKGYLGEKKLYQILKKQLSSDCIIFFDLLLKANRTTFQIDCLILFPESIYMIEVKNYRGDFYLKNDKWFSARSNLEMRNPLLQIERTEFLLNRSLQGLRVNFPIQSYVIFVHDEFWLYQAPMSLPIIYQPQLRRFIQSMNHKNRGNRIEKRHTKIAEILLEQNMDETPYVRLPNFEFNSLRKGLICLNCNEQIYLSGYKRLICPHCSYVESVESGVMRHVVEYSLLFPNEKITVGRIHEWCAAGVSRGRIRRILKLYMTLIRKSQLTYYDFN